MRGRTARFLVPEIVQTSGMDCGPACLKALLEGFDIPVDYGRLREACQTSLDGTSIDTLEDIATGIGLDAEQVMLPIEHLLAPEAAALPAILVVRRPDGFTHFVVAWRVHLGRWVQIMDPARGRYWMPVTAFLGEAYRHRFRVSSEHWSQWAMSEDFLVPLARRLGKIWLDAEAISQCREEVLASSSWTTAAAWDAATRMVEDLVRHGSLRRRKSTRRLLMALVSSGREGSRESIPENFWSVTPSCDSDEAGGEDLIYRGAVLVRVKGRASEPASGVAPMSQLRGASPEKASKSPASKVLASLGSESRSWPRLAAAVGLATSMILAEAILFRGLLDLESYLAPGIDRWITMLLIAAFVTGNRALLLLTDLDLRRLGRRLEGGLRTRWRAKLSRIDPAYFRSRPVSDTAERAHRMHRLRDIPASASRLLRAVVEVVLTSAGMIWIYPEMALVIFAAGLSAVVLPFATQPWLAERDLKIRTHTGALGRFVLETLQGRSVLQGHGAEKALRYEHDELLKSWGSARYRFAALHGLTEGVQIALVLTCVIWIVASYVSMGRDPAGVLLLAYWGVTMPFRGREVIYANLAWAGQRSLLLRIDELLESPERCIGDESASMGGAQEQDTACGVAFSLRAVEVFATGHRLLEVPDLEVAAGSHVAIVGESGAGKSTFLRLLLGLHLPETGDIRVDGETLDEMGTESLRRVTAWVDPTIRLWNRSLMENLAFGAPSHDQPAWANIVDLADLDEVLDHLPDGLQTVLGDAGGRLSGGEGQRVRLGRALAKDEVRLALLDEPFRGLDRARRSRLLGRVREHWRNATLLCVTHDVSETLQFDRVLVLEAGRLVEEGIPSELADRAGSTFARLLGAEQRLTEELRNPAAWTRHRIEEGRSRKLDLGESAF